MIKKFIDFYNKTPLWIFILAVTLILGVVAFASSAGDSLTVDESPHIAAGYSYIAKGDYRLNPEHPPLLKLLSGASIWVGSKVFGFSATFPDNISAWNDRVNAQWDLGYAFLFNAGNDANTIIWWARLPTIIILLLGAVYLAYSVKYHTKGKSIALIALVLYAFSPSVIAHGRLVTTDLVASLAFLVVIDIWVRYLKTPNKKHILALSISMGLAFLAKFSTILLLPLFAATGVAYIVIKNWKSKKQIFTHSVKLIRDGLLVAFGVFFIINIVYFIAMRNMSIDTQLLLVQDSFPQDNQISSFTKQALSSVIEIPGLQYFGQYLLGQAMVIQRVGGGNTTFLIGKFTNQSFTEYFPITYILKEHIGVIFSLFSIILVVISSFIVKLFRKLSSIKSSYILDHYYEINLILMVMLYWVVSIKGNLNLGIRHILPAVIMTYILIAIGIRRVLIPLKFSNLILFIFGIWYILTSLLSYPNYISYLNILAGHNQGYQIFTDSNLDWGQDLKRLSDWTKRNNIDTLYIDYFGTADVKYYLPDIKLIPVKSSDGPKIGYTAISATMLQDSFYKKQIDLSYQEYWWLGWKKPDYIIGNSILIYYNNKY